jgi:hypothetical protein
MDEQIEAEKTMSDKAATLLSTYKTQIFNDATINTELRDQANRDFRVTNVTGGQWEDGYGSDWNSPGGTDGDGDRDIASKFSYGYQRVEGEYDLISPAVNVALSDWNTNRVGVDYRAADTETSEDDTKLLNNLYRTDFMQNGGKEALDNAVLEAFTCGVGYVKLSTYAEDEADPISVMRKHRRIHFSLIANGFNCVFFNPGALRKQNKDDAIRCTVLAPWTKDEFETAYPGKKFISVFDPEDRKFDNYSSSQPDTIHIATRYDRIRTDQKNYIYSNLRTKKSEVFAEEEHKLRENELKRDKLMVFETMEITHPYIVKKSVFSGAEFLKDPEKISGDIIPIAPFYAKRGFTDGLEWYYGIPRKLINAQQAFNVQLSSWTEVAGGQNSSIPIVTEEMVPPEFQDEWKDLTNAPFLRIKAKDAGGNPLSPSDVGFLPAPQVSQASQLLVQAASSYIKEVTGAMPQDTIDPNSSGKAINAMIKQINKTTQPMQDNIKTGVVWMGKIYKSLANDVYANRREIMLMKEDGTESMHSIISTEFDDDIGQLVEQHAINGKRFSTYASAGPQFETEREASIEHKKALLLLSDKIPALRAMAPLIAGELIQELPNVSQNTKKFVRNQLLIAQMIPPENEEEKAVVLQAIEAKKGNKSSQDKYMEAAAFKEVAEGKNLSAGVEQKLADAKKKESEKLKILTEIGIDRKKSTIDTIQALAELQEKGINLFNTIPVTPPPVVLEEPPVLEEQPVAETLN